ncbi:MAG: MotA/TolQ/ExbB proton channel family protein, partial [Planctomycetota bacterium]
IFQSLVALSTTTGPATGSTGPMVMTLLDRGGWVMGVLLIVSVIAIALCMERTWFWWRQRDSRSRAQVLAERLRQQGGRVLLERGRRTVVDQFVQIMSKSGGGGSPSAAMEAAEHVRPQMERFMAVLSTVITAAPLLGILGTVVGIISSFELLGDARLVTDPRQVSGGIAEALLTTQVGLIIALVLLLPYMLFRQRLDRELGRLDLLIAAAEEGAGRSAETDVVSSQSQGPSASGTTESRSPTTPVDQQVSDEERQLRAEAERSDSSRKQ